MIQGILSITYTSNPISIPEDIIAMWLEQESIIFSTMKYHISHKTELYQQILKFVFILYLKIRKDESVKLQIIKCISLSVLPNVRIFPEVRKI